MDNHVRLLREVTATLKSVKDTTGAKAALPTLRRLAKELEASDRALDKARVDRKSPPERLENALGALEKEVKRVDSDPRTSQTMRDLPMFREHRARLESAVRQQVQFLSKFVEEYKRLTGAYPRTIAALAEPLPTDAPLVREDALRDRWGQPIQYDPTGKRNKGATPDVWSLGHPVEKKLIGNWKSTKDDDKGKDRK